MDYSSNLYKVFIQKICNFSDEDHSYTQLTVLDYLLSLFTYQHFVSWQLVPDMANHRFINFFDTSNLR